MANAHIGLRKAIKASLDTDPQIQSIINKRDLAQVTGQFGDVDVRDSQSWPWRSATFEGMRHKFLISAQVGRTEQARADQLCLAIIDKLNDADIELPGHALIELSLSHSTMGQVDNHLSCELEFEALTVSD